MTAIRYALLLVVLWDQSLFSCVYGWTSSNRRALTSRIPSHVSASKKRPLQSRSKNPTSSPAPNSRTILDVEFERVPETIEDSGSSETSTFGSNRTSSSSSSVSRTWLEWSLEADPELNTTRIPFCAASGGGIDNNNDNNNNAVSAIDTKLAFLVDLDGQRYAIGVPYDHTAALALEHPDGRVEYLSPNDDNNVELMELMAVQLHEHVSPNLQLLRTPRVLTIRGPLDEYKQNWQRDLLPKPLSLDQFLDDSDEDVDDFHRFMKEELGEDVYRQTLNESPDDNIPPHLLALFNVPGIGVQEDDTDGMQELLQSILKSPEDQLAELQDLEFAPLSHDGVALKIVSYVMPDTGKAYSLVSLMRPLVMVARMVHTPEEDPDGDEIRFELLSPHEEQILIPRLEQVCQADLEKAGLQLLKP